MSTMSSLTVVGLEDRDRFLGFGVLFVGGERCDGYAIPGGCREWKSLRL